MLFRFQGCPDEWSLNKTSSSTPDSVDEDERFDDTPDPSPDLEFINELLEDPATDDHGVSGMEVINAVANLLALHYADGCRVLSDAHRAALLDLSAKFDQYDQDLHQQNNLRRPTPDDLRSYTQLSTRFKQSKSRSSSAVQPTLHACRVMMMAGNIPDKPVTHNRVMKRIVDLLIIRHPSPVKNQGRRESANMQVALAYNCIRKSLEDSSDELAALIPLLPCGTTRIANYKRKREDATTRRIM